MDSVTRHVLVTLFSLNLCYILGSLSIMFQSFKIHCLTDCWEVLDCCRITFEKTIFSDDINSLEMNSVNWAIFKDVNKVDEIEDIDFFEVAQFVVQRMYEERLERLVSFWTYWF